MFDFRDAVCNSMEEEFDSRLDALRKAKELTSGLIGDINNALGSLIPTEGFNDALNAIPDPPSVDSGVLDDLGNMMAECGWLSESPKFGNAANILKNLKNKVIGLGKDIIGALNMPEVNSAMLIDQLKDILGANGLDVKSLVEAMDKILTCLNAVCGRDISSRLTEMQGLMDDLRLTDNGQVDSERIFSDNGLSGEVLTNVTNAKSKIESVQDTLSSQIKSLKVPGI